MRIDPRFRLDVIADGALRDILQHVLITRWHDEPVAVVADGYTMVVVPIDLDEREPEGLLHVSVLKRAYELVGVGNDDSAFYPSEVQIRLGHTRAQLSDGSIMRRAQETGGKSYPNIQQVIPEALTDASLGPVFGINPALLQRTADALGVGMVAVHRANETQIVVAPAPLDGPLEPPFAVMMLAKVERRKPEEARESVIA